MKLTWSRYSHRQFDRRSRLLVMWRGDAPAREVLVFRVVGRRNPEGGFEHAVVNLDGAVVAAEFESVRATKDELSFTGLPAGLDPRPARVRAVVEIEPGLLQVLLAPEGRVAEIAAWVHGELDIELLEFLHDCYLHDTGQGGEADSAGKSADWSGWAPGDLVAWDEAFPLARVDAYVVEKRQFVSRTMFCITPACDCTDGVVEFLEVRDQVADLKIGSGQFDAARSHLPAALEGAEAETGQAGVFLQLWERYRARHRTHGVMRRRMARMKEFGAKMFASRGLSASSRGAFQRVGRNDPCPCGSGRKYKKCRLQV
jgi:hypothetical protein